MADHKLKVFLCHSSTDKPLVRDLYKRLLSEPWLDPWLDEENLLPGQDWDMEIEKAVEAADVVLVCVSNNSVTKEGYVQRELKFALDVALEKPEGTIFVIPLRLDDCNLPRRLRTWQYVDYFPAQQRERAYQRLLQSLKIRYQQGFSTGLTENIIPQPVLEGGTEIENSHNQKIITKDVVQSQFNNTSLFDWVGYLILLFYFAIEVIIYINDTNTFLDYSKILLLTFAGLYFVKNRHLPISPSFAITILIYMFLYPIVFFLLQSGNEFSTGWTLLMVSSVLVGGSLISVFQAPMKKVAYSAIFLGIFLLLVASQLVLQFFGNYESPIFIMQIIASVITAISIWREL